MFLIPPQVEPVIEDIYTDFTISAGSSRELIKDEEMIAFLGNIIIVSRSASITIEHTINNQVWKQSIQSLINWGLDERVDNYWYCTKAVGGVDPYYTAVYQGNGEPYTRYKLVLYNDTAGDIIIRFVGTQRWWLKGMGKELPEEMYKKLGFAL